MNTHPTGTQTQINETRQSAAAAAGTRDLLRLVAAADGAADRLAGALGRTWSTSSTDAVAADLRGLVELAAQRDEAAEMIVAAMLGKAPAGHRLLAAVRRFHSTARLREAMDDGAPDAWCRTCQELGGRRTRGRELADTLRGGCDRLLADLMRDRPVGPVDRAKLVALLNLEIEARDERIRALACRLMDREATQSHARLNALAVRDARTTDLRALVNRLAEDGGRDDLVLAHNRFLVALGADGRRVVDAVIAGCPDLERVAMVWRGITSANPGLPDPAAGFRRLWELARTQGEVPLLPTDPDPLALAALVVGGGRDGLVRLPVAEAAAALLDADPTACILPQGITREGGELCVRCDDAVRTVAIGPTPAAAKEEPAVEQGAAAVKRLVLGSMQSISALTAYLRDQRITSIPGLVAEVVARTRNPQIIEIIATQRSLHTGFANRGVPLVLLRSPVNVPPKTLRKFAHVKYVSKVDLKRLANDKAGIRKEIHREIEKYLDSLT